MKMSDRDKDQKEFKSPASKLNVIVITSRRLELLQDVNCVLTTKELNWYK